MTIDVCDKIRLLRISHNLTQEDIAEQLELSVSGYAKIERGETDLSISRLEQISKVFNISIIDLLTVDKPKSNQIVNFNCENKSINSKNQIYFSETLSESYQNLHHEIEKLKLIVESQGKEIELLKTLLNIQRLNV